MLAALKGIYLLEVDKSKTTFTWGFPTVEKDIQHLITQRTGFDGLYTAPLDQPICHRYKQQWIYSLNFEAQFEQQPEPNGKDYLRSTTYSLIILVENYNPPAYIALIKALVSIYMDTKTTTAVLTAYLQANSHAKLSHALTKTTGTITWDMASHDQRMALIQPIHTILDRFGLESIVIWIAVLLKKRIFITSNDPIELSSFTRAVVAFGAWHRKDQQIPSLRPFVVNLKNPNEVSDIKSTPGCIAGVLTPNNNIEHFEELWDLHIDLTQNAISINNNSKQFFALGKFHKSIAEYFLTALTQAREAAGSGPDAELVISQTVIKASMTKEKEIVELLSKLKNESTNLITAESIKGNVPANLEGFIYNVAVAEGLV